MIGQEQTCKRCTNTYVVSFLGQTHCDSCLKKRHEKQRIQNEKGLCSFLFCRNSPTLGYKTCDYHRERCRLSQARRAANGMCRGCQNRALPGRSACHKCLRETKERGKRIKIESLTAYGGCICVCCGETRYEFLQLDHTNGDGATQRKQIGKTGRGQGFYLWLKRNGYPPGLRVLCSNCNSARGFYGYCPHEKEREANQKT